MAREDITGIDITCPKINEIIDMLHSFVEFNTPKDKEEILIKLEEVRFANAQLRKFGNDLYSEKQQEILELECKISRLEKKISELEVALKEATLDGEALTKALEQYV